MPTKRAAVYTRISLDRTGESASPARQEALCRELAEAKGWRVTEVFSDRSVSGWKKKTERPAFRELEQAVSGGGVDVVMAYSLSRLGRRAGKLLEFVDLLREHDTELSLYTEQIDTSSPGGKMVLAVLAAVAEMYSDEQSAAMKSSHARRIADGRMMNGGSRQFGFNHDGTHVPSEKREIQAVVKRLLAGKSSLNAEARRLNDKGVTTTQGNTWRGNTLKQMLTSPRLAGLQRSNGGFVRGDWTPIVPEEQWYELRAKLDHRTPGRPPSTRATLLGGLVRCGNCGKPMYLVGISQSYGCSTSPGRGGCGKTAKMARVDEYVTKRWAEFIVSARIAPVEDGMTMEELDRRITELKEQKTTLSRAHYIEKRLDKTEYADLHDELQQELVAREHSREVLVRRAADERLLPGDMAGLEAWWDTATLTERHDAIARAVDYVTIAPTAKRGPDSYKGRVSVTFRSETVEPALRAEQERTLRGEFDPKTKRNRDHRQAAPARELEAVIAEANEVAAARAKTRHSH